MAYSDKSETPLKWHRLRQILIMPATILALGYGIACFVIDYFKIDFPGFYNIVSKALAKLDIDLHVSGGLQKIILIAAACMVLVFLLELLQWLKSFRWKKTSLVCEILMSVLFIAGSCFVIYAMAGMGYAAKAAEIASAAFNKRIETLAVNVICGIFFGVVILYALLNFCYYIKRRKLYGRKKNEDDDIPFIDDTAELVRPVVEPTPVQPAPKPEPVVENVRKSDDLLADAPEEIEKTAAVLGLKFCTNCGTRLSKEDLSMTYCKYCGHKFEKK